MSQTGTLGQNVTKESSILTSTAGEIDGKLFMYRDGKKLRTPSGADDLSSFLRGFEIYESMASACMEMRLILEDSAAVFWQKKGTARTQDCP